MMTFQQVRKDIMSITKRIAVIGLVAVLVSVCVGAGLSDPGEETALPTPDVSGLTNTYTTSYIRKVAVPSFVPETPGGEGTDGSNLGDFMVAELRTTGTMFMDTDLDYVPVDDGAIRYAVVPKTYIGTHDVTCSQGVYGEFSFGYPISLYALIAEAPEGHFTKDEAAEVIAILSTFRSAD